MKFRGVNHLAMVTNDMEKTVRFYRDVLQMPLVAAIGNTPAGYPYRHYFFETGPNSTIAFFEWPGMVEEFHKPAGQPARGRLQFDHVSFDVEDEDGLLELQDRLSRAGVEVTQVIDHKFIHSIYFHDPNGIALEASVWITNPTGQAPDYANPHVFQDQNPVPALKEQIEQARLVERS
ncbi:MAG: VOC family protein [Dehalococcoidia bacterium]|jgi:catechol 2,3-dioxygenase-like lactoylglutathione lyase family enzyme|nr:VOC family protein [Dehalococcoidia bacterium]MDP6227866.1 VOC family protein [Dehalococcoidia bacterium]MDP7085031.1 VOC family protein [Dehalococcoidia bacterium]MDP7201930.1 VOC family protein [Dehalococcoidia bacterium]MDP7510090.1 VOC family protein [Dehalococcoidia bacterium]